MVMQPPPAMLGDLRQFRQLIPLRAPTGSFLVPVKFRRRCSCFQAPRSIRRTCPPLISKKCITAASAVNLPSDLLASTTRTAEDLQDAFGRQGLTFLEEAGGAVAAELKLNNGTRARLLLPRAQIISYKPHMWHGGEEEWLYVPSSRSRSRSRSRATEFNTDSIVGGIDLRLGDNQLVDSSEQTSTLSPERWTVEGVDCNPSKYAQITLSSSLIHPPENARGTQVGRLQGRYVVTLTDQYLSLALVVTNTGPSTVEFTSSIATHLAVSSVEGTMVVGLKGQQLYSRSPAPKERPSNLSFGNMIFRALAGFKRGKTDGESALPQIDSSAADDDADTVLNNGEGYWTVESGDYSQLRGGDDRTYPTPPTSFTVLDRGFRRSLRVQRLGFREFFVMNPGPASLRPDWDNFICLGPAETTNSVRLSENEQWQAAQVLWNTGSD